MELSECRERLDVIDAKILKLFEERMELAKNDSWTGKKISELGLPRDLMVALIIRSQQYLIPRGEVILQAGDVLVVGAKAARKAGQTLNAWKPILLTEEPSVTFVMLVQP